MNSKLYFSGCYILHLLYILVTRDLFGKGKLRKIFKFMASLVTCARGHLGCNLDPQQLLHLAQKTAPRDWKRLLLDQGLEDYVLEQIECDYESQGCVEVARQGFKRWQEQFPEKVSLCQITKALSAIGRNDLKNDFEAKYFIKGMKSTFIFFFFFFFFLDLI